MRQPITEFVQDDEGHWVALLACGHRQHMRHEPPFLNRPWVITEEGRQSRLGRELECAACDQIGPASQTDYSDQSANSHELPVHSPRNYQEVRALWLGFGIACLAKLAAGIAYMTTPDPWWSYWVGLALSTPSFLLMTRLFYLGFMVQRFQLTPGMEVYFPVRGRWLQMGGAVFTAVYLGVSAEFAVNLVLGAFAVALVFLLRLQ